MTKPRVIAAVTIGHLAIDVFNSMGPVLLAFLRAPLMLSAGQIGLAAGLYQFLAGSTQPAFGWLVDRAGSRVLGPLSVAWTLCCTCLALAFGLARGSFGAFLFFFALAAVGSGAFHPQGTMHAGSPAAGRAARTTAYFFFFGQLGLSAGPVLAGLALDRAGVRGIYVLAAAAMVVPLAMVAAMGSRRHNPPPVHEASPSLFRPAGQGSWNAVGLLGAVFALRAWAFIGTASFLPLLFELRGWSSTRQGLVTGLFWFGGGVAGVVAGAAADRWSRRPVVALTTLSGALLLWRLPIAEGDWVLPLAMACGALLGAPHSVLMVMAQSLLPVRRGLASGLALGFLFASGALASWAIGLLADRFGLVPVLQAGALSAAAAAAFSLLLPSSRSSETAEA